MRATRRQAPICQIYDTQRPEILRRNQRNRFFEYKKITGKEIIKDGVPGTTRLHLPKVNVHVNMNP